MKPRMMGWPASGAGQPINPKSVLRGWPLGVARRRAEFGASVMLGVGRRIGGELGLDQSLEIGVARAIRVAANARAMPSPMPLVEPVTIAAFPSGARAPKSVPE